MVGLIAGFSGVAAGSPYCDADLVEDGQLDFFDVAFFVGMFTEEDPVADFDGNGVFDFFDLSSFLEAYASCPDLTDTDGDRIPDFAETDDGVYLSELATGSDPLNADTDGDGIEDGDEVLGTVEGLDLRALGASPVYKDIFVECDWFAGTFQGRQENYRPTPAVAERVRLAFKFGGAPNPYGAPDGVNIHLDYGQGFGFTGGNQLPGQPVFIVFDSEFNQYKADHFDPRRKGYFHYAIFANRYNSSTNGSSGFAEVNGDDFMVTMVNYNSTNNMAAALMHELGHNLGLLHGGNQNRNYKVNYNSVMNYRYTFSGVDTNDDIFGDGVLDYSFGWNHVVNEASVDETVGVLGGPIDFNFNGQIDVAPYALNLNCSGAPVPCGQNGNGSCYDSSCTTLSDFDDWSNINWARLGQSVDRLEEADVIECMVWPGKGFGSGEP
jgi:hypothetical protein